MMGRSHALVGGATWLGIVAVAARCELPVDGTGIVLSTVAAVAASLAPDVDHPGSTTTRNMGLIGTALSWAVRKIARGHRGLTHSIGAVGIAMALTAAAGLHRWTLALLLGLLVGTALDIMPKVPEGVEWIAALLVGACSTSIAAAIPWWLLPAAVGWGWHSHLPCDCCTRQKIPYLWPLVPHTRRVSWDLFSTGGAGERWTVRATCAATGLLVLQLH